MTATTASSPTAAKPSPLAWLERITSDFLLQRLVKALFTIWPVATITYIPAHSCARFRLPKFWCAS